METKSVPVITEHREDISKIDQTGIAVEYSKAK